MDPRDLASDVLLSERLSSVSPGTALACAEGTSTSLAAEATQPRSLTVTPEQASGEMRPCSSAKESSDGLPNHSEAEVKDMVPCGKGNEGMIEDKGLRRKFLRFLEQEARKKSRSLTELRRRSATERDGNMQAKLLALSIKISSELKSVEELLIENQEALVNEHLEMVIDRRASTVSSSFSATSDSSCPRAPATAGSATPPAPTHWRPRIRRATPHTCRKDICASLDCQGENAKNVSAEPNGLKNGLLRQKSAPQRYCETVENRVKPLLNPIDRVLGKISSLVHGPTPAESQLRLNSRTNVASSLPRYTGSSAEQQAAAKVRMGFWGSLVCGACVDGSFHNQRKDAMPSGATTEREIAGMLHSANISTMLRIEEQLDAEVRATLGKIKCQLADQHECLDGSFGHERVREHGTPLFASEIQVPVSSLQIDRAVAAVLPQHEIAECVVELAEASSAAGRVFDSPQDHKLLPGVAHTRRKLFESLGGAGSNSRHDQSAYSLKCLTPQPDPKSPITPMPSSVTPTSGAQPVFFLAGAQGEVHVSAESPSTPQPPPRIWGTPMTTDADLQGVVADLVAEGNEQSERVVVEGGIAAELQRRSGLACQQSSSETPSTEHLRCLPLTTGSLVVV